VFLKFRERVRKSMRCYLTRLFDIVVPSVTQSTSRK